MRWDLLNFCILGLLILAWGFVGATRPWATYSNSMSSIKEAFEPDLEAFEVVRKELILQRDFAIRDWRVVQLLGVATCCISSVIWITFLKRTRPKTIEQNRRPASRLL
jgi:hypothetical protein